MNAQLFVEYTKRYEEVVGCFPKDCSKLRLALEVDEMPPESEELRLAILRYLNLCSEEFYLYRRHYLSKRIWTIWEAELNRVLRSKLLRREWQAVRDEYQSFPEWRKYVEAVQASPDGALKHSPDARSAELTTQPAGR
jgi:hypothetical protein